MPARKPNKRSSIYLGSDGWWHGWVTIGIKDDGSPDRRHRKARTEAAVTRKVRELERTRDSGHMPGAGRPIMVGQWMETWLTTIAPRRVRRSTLETTYAPKVRNRIIPGLGKHRLDRLTPEHIERFYTRLEAEGLAPATVLQIHRILSRALKVAMQRGYVTRNVATLVDAPSASQDEIEPLSLGEALRIVRLAATTAKRHPLERRSRPRVAARRSSRSTVAVRRSRCRNADRPLAAPALRLAARLRRSSCLRQGPPSRRLPARLHSPRPFLPAANRRRTPPHRTQVRQEQAHNRASVPSSSRHSKRTAPPNSTSA